MARGPGVIRRLFARLRARYGSHDPALHLPPDPRDVAREKAAWSCPAVVHGSRCGLPKAPENATCGRPKCRAWGRRQERSREIGARVLPMAGRKGAGDA